MESPPPLNGSLQVSVSLSLLPELKGWKFVLQCRGNNRIATQICFTAINISFSTLGPAALSTIRPGWRAWQPRIVLVWHSGNIFPVRNGFIESSKIFPEYQWKYFTTRLVRLKPALRKKSKSYFFQVRPLFSTKTSTIHHISIKMFFGRNDSNTKTSITIAPCSCHEKCL